MYFRDHPPPHFHARYAGEEAVISIATGEVIAGSLPGRALRLVREWTEMHRDELDANWGPCPRPSGVEPGLALAVTGLVRIADVRPLEGHWLRLWFTNGVVKDVDLSEALAGGGVFDEIHRRRDVFEQVRVNPESRTIEWPGGIDLDPDVLYGAFEAADDVRIERRLVTEPAIDQR